jgi:hypothetical protein
MTKSPRAVAREAVRRGQESLPTYSSKFARLDYTQHQLFVLPALNTFLQTDYWGLSQMLADFAELCEDLELAAPPDPTNRRSDMPGGDDLGIRSTVIALNRWAEVGSGPGAATGGRWPGGSPRSRGVGSITGCTAKQVGRERLHSA